MKYCIKYYKNFRYNDVIDEVILDYATYRNSIIEKLQEQNWKDNQRIIIDVVLGGTPEIIPTLKMCQKIHENLAIRLDIIQEEMVAGLREANIPFFYANYAKTADEVYGMIKHGVSDIYITESLAFDIENVGSYCKSKNVKVRIIPNIAQYRAGFRSEIPDQYKFFVRPEDVKLYEAYADVFEIIGSDDRLSILYEIYKNEVWDGDLKQLIVGIDEPFLNAGMIALFGPYRLSCGHRCMQEKCSLCLQAKELSTRFADNGLKVIKDKNKEWKNETRSYQEAMRIIEKTTSNGNGKISEK